MHKSIKYCTQHLNLMEEDVCLLDFIKIQCADVAVNISLALSLLYSNNLSAKSLLG